MVMRRRGGKRAASVRERAPEGGKFESDFDSNIYLQNVIKAGRKVTWSYNILLIAFIRILCFYACKKRDKRLFESLIV